VAPTWKRSPNAVSSRQNVIGHTDPDAFARVVQMAADGTLSVPITRTFTFDELPQALRLVGEERSRGKFAIKISP
jgi:NADPH:quinone reductase-like Zn-dependent oxidoreductase